MASILDELEDLDRKLKGFPPDAHWFCPKRQDDDTHNYDEPDLDEPDLASTTKIRYIAEGHKRLSCAYRFSLVFGLAPEDAGDLLVNYAARTTQFLTSCDRCVRNYHLGRKGFLKDLAEEFDEDIVQELTRRIEDVEFTRIDNGLFKAEKVLSSVPDSQKHINSLAKGDFAALTGLYEALCCESYHKSPEKLFFPLGDVMRLVQIGKPLRLGDLVPATTRFLFDEDQFRHRFATNGWKKSPETMDSNTFDWAVKGSLIDAMQSVSSPAANMVAVKRFWDGIQLIVDKLDHSLITHSLQGMEVQPDIYHLALQHLACNSDDVLAVIIKTLRILLRKSPQTFWEAYGAISPATVAEQVFSSPAFETLLSRSFADEVPDEEHVPDAVAWIPSFVQSLPPAQQHDACRSVLFNLLERFQDGRMSERSRIACCRAGLDTLVNTLTTFTDRDYKINPSTSFIMINGILSLVDKYKDVIVSSAMIVSDLQSTSELSRLGMLIIRRSLSLDCKALNSEFQALQSGGTVDHGLDSHSQSIWSAVLGSLRPNGMEIARHILVGITPLIGLESFTAESRRDRVTKALIITPLSKDRMSFNDDFGQLTEIIALVFGRLMDFTPDNLKLLCTNQLTARPLLAALTAADQATNEAAVEVIKTLTGEDGRTEAIAKLLDDFLEATLNALAFAARKINGFQTFAAVPSVLKIGRDVLDTLCDAQVGILRIRSSPTIGEQAAIKMWWSEQWHVVTGAFSMTEKWSEARSSSIMTEFCRDAMDYAEALFDQYILVASVLNSNDGNSTSSLNDARKIVLQDPREAVEGLIRFLRLRDPYLASTIVSLLSKILRRLGEFDMEIDVSPSRYIESVVKTVVDDKGRIVGKEKGGINTILTGQQKAELWRALEEHHGLQEIQQPTPSPLKKQTGQGTIDAWSKSANGVHHEPHTTLKADLKQSFINTDRWQSSASLSDSNEDRISLTRNLDTSLSTLDEIRSRHKEKESMIKNALPGAKAGETPKQTREREKEEKRKRDVAFAKSQRNPALVTGEGSAMKGLGVRGKDHAPLKGELMVGSDDESSEDDDETDANSLIKSSKEGSRKAVEQEENRKRLLKQNQPQGPVRKTKIVRSAKDMRARLIPNMDNLHLTILDWDIFHQGEDPPGGIEYLGVTESFKSPLAYKDTFHPLLISEAWRSFSSAKDESNYRPFQIKVVNRMSVDQFYEVSTSMAIAENRELNILEGDIVLLSKGTDPLKDSQLPNCLARAMKITRKKEVVEVSYRVSVSSASNKGLISSLAPNLSIHGFKITSMTTIEREYAALASLEYYDLCDEILEAKPSPLLPYSQQVIDPVRRIYDVNMGQAKAVWSAKENDAFTLIQGPPGSGKTKTIVAMVGALLTDTFVATGVSIERPRTSGTANNSPKLPQKKLLVCAPSNAAVDELVHRLKEGVKTLRGEFHKINVIRLGRSDAINANVKDVTLDELVRAKIEGKSNGQTEVSEREKLHLEAGRLKEQLAILRPQLEEARSKDDKILESRLQRDYDNKRRDQLRIGARIDAEKDSGNTAARDNEIRRRLLQQEIIDSAHVLCATLSGSGHEMFKNLKVEFETVIIDEAAQCVELSALIPLKYGCSKCILVGDPKQLPPTVLSRSAARNGYERSLFVRMQENHPDSVHLLDMQYRMHPEISRFPSAQFYDGKLLDGSDMATLREKPWHKSQLLGPYRFFDVNGVQATGSRGHSFTNMEELRVAMQLYERLRSDYNDYDLRGKVGIITPYKAQLAELRNRFRDKYGEGILDEIEFNTTDAFQGRESEVIIFSCVRARASGGIGFLEDIRRMNVGLTRAKSSLWVLGDSKSLFQGEFWAKLINDAKSRKVYTDGDILAKLKKASTDSRSLSKNQNVTGALVNRSLPKPSLDSRGNPTPKLSIPDSKPRSLDGLKKRPLTPKLESEGPSVKKHHTKSESPKDIEMVDAPPMADDTKPASPPSGNADDFLKRYRRLPSPLHDVGHVGKKIPTGPKAMSRIPPIISTTGSARTPAGVDPAAMATLKVFQNQALPISNTEPPTPLPHKPSEPSISSTIPKTNPHPTNGGMIPPRIVKKRPPADPLRRNLPPTSRPR